MIKFTKMHGCGNDYIYVNCLDGMDFDPSELAIAASDRHKGIGSDGLVCICRSDKADAFMRMWNADGSEGRMCGNAIRCVGKYLYDHGICKKENIEIETLSGIKHLRMKIENGVAAAATVDMGRVSFDGSDVPAKYDGECIGKTVMIAGGFHKITTVSVGSPHCVTFVDDPGSLDLPQIGPKYENDPFFPDRVNTEFVKQVGENELYMRVWERGSGETLACGTGACAAASAAVKLGLCEPDTEITVHLTGGDLYIRYTDDAVFMTGEAVTVFDGEYFGD